MVKASMEQNDKAKLNYESVLNVIKTVMELLEQNRSIAAHKHLSTLVTILKVEKQLSDLLADVNNQNCGDEDCVCKDPSCKPVS